MNTKEVSEKYGVCFTACSRWAKENGVARIPVKGILAYDWSEEDCERFLKRPGRGWKKRRAKKKGIAFPSRALSRG